MIDVVDKIILPISDISTLTIETDCPAKELTPYCDINIVLQDKGKQYVLYDNDCIAGTIWGLAGYFQALLDSELELHESIQQDIGFLWNEDLQDKPELFRVPDSKGINYWVGNNYHIWSSRSGNWDTWFYNKEKKIILEVTPTYKWHYCDIAKAKKDKNYLTYDEFIKSYKPELIIELPREIVQQWVIKFKELVTLIQENHEKKMKEIEGAKKIDGNKKKKGTKSK